MVLTDVVVVVDDDGIDEVTSSSPSDDVGVVVVIRSSIKILVGLGCNDVVVKNGEEALDDKILVEVVVVDDEAIEGESFVFVIPPMLDDILVHPWTFAVIDDKEEMIQTNETNNIFVFRVVVKSKWNYLCHKSFFLHRPCVSSVTRRREREFCGAVDDGEKRTHNEWIM